MIENFVVSIHKARTDLEKERIAQQRAEKLAAEQAARAAKRQERLNTKPKTKQNVEGLGSNVFDQFNASMQV